METLSFAQAISAELVGTAILIFLGNGVVANVLLSKTFGHGSGLIVIAFGWAMAVFIAVKTTVVYSGAHLNPAVTFALAINGSFLWSWVIPYMVAQMLGGVLGATMVFLLYRNHFLETKETRAKLASFCTSPAISNWKSNLFSEMIATFILIFSLIRLAPPSVDLGAIQALPVSLIVLGIGVSLGGTTGYAINPARDLAPRIMHAVLPIGLKESSNWKYAWIPVVGPLIGAALAIAVSHLLP